MERQSIQEKWSTAYLSPASSAKSSVKLRSSPPRKRLRFCQMIWRHSWMCKSSIPRSSVDRVLVLLFSSIVWFVWGRGREPHSSLKWISTTVKDCIENEQTKNLRIYKLTTSEEEVGCLSWLVIFQYPILFDAQWLHKVMGGKKSQKYIVWRVNMNVVPWWCIP